MPDRPERMEPPEDAAEAAHWFDVLRDVWDDDPDGTYIRRTAAEAAIVEGGYDGWVDEINAGHFDYWSASLMIAHGVENPYDADVEVTLRNDPRTDDWYLDWTSGTGGSLTHASIPLGLDVPEWIWEDVYDTADYEGWEWDVTYEEKAS